MTPFPAFSTKTSAPKSLRLTFSYFRLTVKPIQVTGGGRRKPSRPFGVVSLFRAAIFFPTLRFPPRAAVIFAGLKNSCNLTTEIVWQWLPLSTCLCGTETRVSYQIRQLQARNVIALGFYFELLLVRCVAKISGAIKSDPLL